MADFDEILRKSLSIVNDEYQRALDELRVIVAEVRESIKTNAGEEFTVELSELTSNIEGAAFQIFLDTNVNDLNSSLLKIVELQVPANGYPIFIGTYSKANGRFTQGDEKFDNQDEIRNFFANQLSDPNSRFIQLIGFALRRRANKS